VSPSSSWGGCAGWKMTTDHAADHQLAGHLERIIRRVKQSMNYRGSFSTRDILGSLVARWVGSGEGDRLKELAPEQRKLGESVRRVLLDRFDQLRPRGQRARLDSEAITLPDDADLIEMVELAQLRRWIFDRVADLEANRIDPRVRIPLARAREVGAILRLHLDGKTQREIAASLAMSVGAVNKRLA